MRFRVIADHSRTGMMLILDGVTPGNEGRGYILRRLLRRIIRSARLLGARGETMSVFMDTIMDTMTPSYPEIADNRERILKTAVNEEKAFLRTLESGTSLFEEAAASVKASGSTTLAGAQAFTSARHRMVSPLTSPWKWLLRLGLMWTRKALTR